MTAVLHPLKDRHLSTFCKLLLKPQSLSEYLKNNLLKLFREYIYVYCGNNMMCEQVVWQNA